MSSNDNECPNCGEYNDIRMDGEFDIITCEVCKCVYRVDWEIIYSTEIIKEAPEEEEEEPEPAPVHTKSQRRLY